ncbi:aldo/keto reductase [Undibacterium crateris]|uniref:aldo/keto reductase n=1 Tax=Undibacterium crateris TaxID=2528175 RepID=UPI00138A5383|nr:aldo/keto reductase [Undibacterium crateris]NDI84639.1 aryl-alcohol dehydrogenase [Undibacterium crateris]
MSLKSKTKLGLGTVQFGLDYGIANKDGQVSLGTAKAIMHSANEHGLTVIDTAAAYGSSEDVLGACFDEISPGNFSVFTKTKPLRLPEICAEHIEDVEAIFASSLQKMQSGHVTGVLVHHAEDLLVPGGDRLFAQLQGWKAAGKINKIGVSIYDANQLDQLFSRYEFDVVQLPVNVFDQRLIRDGSLQTLANRGVEVHARSLLLQGVLLMQPDDLPRHLQKLQLPLTRLRHFSAERGMSPLSFALGFAKFTKEISVALVGVTSVGHLQECISAYGDAKQFDYSEFAVSEIELLDPRQWPQIQR